MMDCKNLAEIFAGDREDDLTREESVAFDEHLNGCDDCRTLLAEAEGEVDELASAWEPEQPTLEQWERVTQALRTKLAQPQLVVRMPTATQRRNLPAIFAMAASILLLLGVGLIVKYGSDSPDHQSSLKSELNLTPDEPRDPEPRAEPVTIDQPPAELLSFDVGEGFEVEDEVVDDNLLCIKIREKDE